MECISGDSTVVGGGEAVVTTITHVPSFLVLLHIGMNSPEIPNFCKGFKLHLKVK